jgi:Protein kinase domain
MIDTKLVIDTRLASVLSDILAVEQMVPWPCPSVFEPEPRYVLTEVIGATRHSIVYLANDSELSDKDHEATVAIKMTLGTTLGSREALLGRRVTHENVVRMLGRGIVNDSSYVIMEHVDGGTLQDQVVPMKPCDAVRLVRSIAAGVQAIHTAGVYHMDLKPSNVLMTRTGRPVVTDFGLSASDDDRTHDGMGGTLAFMAPEQARGAPDAPPADIYALGGMLFYLLTGEHPNGRTQTQSRERLLGGEPVDCSTIPRTLAHICQRALSIDPTHRHVSAAELSEELRCWEQYLPVRSAHSGIAHKVGLFVRRRPVPTMVIFCLILLLATAIGVVWRDQALEIQAERKAHELAQQELELIQKKAREVVRRVALFTNAFPTTSPSAEVLPILVWMQWLTAKSVVSEMGEIDLAQQREPALENMLLQYELLHMPQSIAAALTRFALAQTQLELGQYEQIDDTLDALEANWVGPRSNEDPFWIAVDSMRETSLLLFRIDQAGTIRPDQLDQLDEVMERLRISPDGKATYLVLKRARDRVQNFPRSES